MITTVDNPDERGLVPLLGLSVSMLEAMMERAGMPVVWADDMTLDDKARVAGLVWIQVTPGAPIA